MARQEIATAGLTIYGNEVKESGSGDWRQTEMGKRISKALRKKPKGGREGMETSDKWRELLLLRDASPQTIEELLNSSQEEDEKSKESIDFARELLRKGLISEDLTAWRSLVLHYRNNKRNFPAPFFDMLRLEVFYKGMQEARRGDLTLLNLYRNTGYMIGSAWFDTSLADEEDFVAGLIDEKPAGINEDRFGYYREDEYGRWRQPVASGNSGIIADSSMQSVSREIIKNFKPQKVR